MSNLPYAVIIVTVVDTETPMSTSGGKKAIVAAFLANLGIAISKFVAFLFTGAASLLAESIHSFADTGNQALLLLGGRLARRAPDPEHQFGYGRERYFWAFVVSLVLFTAGSMFAVLEGIDKIRNPHEIESPIWGFVVLSLAIVLEGLSFRTAVREAAREKLDQSWVSFIRDTRSPELPVVILEDLGALLGLFLALGALTIAITADAPVFDGIGTLSIGVLLGVIAVVLAIQMKSLLIGESASRSDLARIESAIESADGVVRLIHLRTQHLGPDELLVGAKVQFDANLSAREVAQAIDRLEESVRAAVPAARPMYIEPDVMDPERLG